MNTMRTNESNERSRWATAAARTGCNRSALATGGGRTLSLRSGLPKSRRGSVYVMVLMVSLIVMVIGLGSVALSRSTIRATTATADWSEAGVGAQSGVEYALAVMNSSSTWRTDTSSGSTIGGAERGAGEGVCVDR